MDGIVYLLNYTILAVCLFLNHLFLVLMICLISYRVNYCFYRHVSGRFCPFVLNK